MNRAIILLIPIIAVAVAAALAAPSGPAPIGKVDFRAYWSASYLLAHGRNFSNPNQMLEVERALTEWYGDYGMMTWNPPWALVLLEPLTLLPFERATWVWIFANLLLAFTGAMLWWHSTARQPSTRKRIWIPALFLVGYAPTVVAIAAGQMSIVVLFGLALFIFLDAHGLEWEAGAALALTLVKPHLVYVTVPLVLLQCWQNRCWRTLLAFILLLAGLTAIAIYQRPQFPADYITTMGQGGLLDWETPTLGGWLDLLFGWKWAKVMGLALLPAAVLMWWRGPRLGMAHLIELTCLASVITAPFGWSYDFEVLLLPLLGVATLLVEGRLPRPDSIAIILVLIVAGGLAFAQRVQGMSELYSFWIPVLVAAIYLFSLWRVKRSEAETRNVPVPQVI